MHILLIEDEPKTVHSLKQGLEENQIDVDFAYDGQLGKLMATKKDYDVIISDIILPHINGLDLVKQLRTEGIQTPILLLSALSDTDDKVNGLEAGCDDYLSKPFELKELIARVRALVRRHGTHYQAAPILHFEDLELNLHTKECWREGTKINLTPKEFAFMEYLIKNQGRVVSKAEIAEHVWEIDFDTNTNVIEVYVNYLRNKIDKPFARKLIHTQFGAGYILKAD